VVLHMFECYITHKRSHIALTKTLHLTLLISINITKFGASPKDTDLKLLMFASKLQYALVHGFS
jgi:hypothetical protein